MRILSLVLEVRKIRYPIKDAIARIPIVPLAFAAQPEARKDDFMVDNVLVCIAVSLVILKIKNHKRQLFSRL